jgi:hypothetical protein
MQFTKKIDFGEYLIIAIYDDVSGSLKVTVLDELEEVIETINVENDDDSEENDTFIKPSLN